jgi:hypothetical protein
MLLAGRPVQVRDQKERGVAYRYYVEQAAALPGFLGAPWTDEDHGFQFSLNERSAK